MFEDLNSINFNDIRRCDNRIPSQLNAKGGFTSKRYTNPRDLLEIFFSSGITRIRQHVSNNTGDVISCSVGKFGSYSDARSFIYKISIPQCDLIHEANMNTPFAVYSRTDLIVVAFKLGGQSSQGIELAFLTTIPLFYIKEIGSSKSPNFIDINWDGIKKEPSQAKIDATDAQDAINKSLR